MVRDDEEAIFFITPKEDISITSREDVAIWTNSRAFVYMLKTFFEELWRNAKDLKSIQKIEVTP